MGPATSAWLRYVFAVLGFLVWCWICGNKEGTLHISQWKEGMEIHLLMALLGTMGYQLLFMNEA